MREAHIHPGSCKADLRPSECTLETVLLLKMSIIEVVSSIKFTSTFSNTMFFFPEALLTLSKKTSGVIYH